MSARKQSSPLGSKHRKRLGVVCLAIACALIAVGLYAWQSKPVAETGASVTAAEGKSRQEIQDELDAIVRDNMMTISVAPVAQLQKGGKLRVNVQNVQDNKFPQRFRVIQNDEPSMNRAWSRPARPLRPAPQATSKKVRRISRFKRSTPRPTTPMAIPRASRCELRRPKTRSATRCENAHPRRFRLTITETVRDE